MARKLSYVCCTMAVIASSALTAGVALAGPNSPKPSAPQIVPVRPDITIRAPDVNVLHEQDIRRPKPPAKADGGAAGGRGNGADGNTPHRR
jgi:hypothetical protein